MCYVDVAVPLPIDRLYTYLVPEELRDDIAVGKRALIPFGRKYLTGYIVQIATSSSVEQVKEIADLLDPEPVVTPNVLRLTKWIAEYYFCSWGLAIKAALPAGINIAHSLTITVNPPPESAQLVQDFFQPAAPSRPGKIQKKILKILQRQPSISLSELQKKVGKKSLYSSLYSLERQQRLTLHQVTKTGAVKPKTLQHIVLAQEPDALPALPRRAPNQSEILRILTELFPGDLSLVELQNRVDFDARSAIKSLVQKGYVRQYSKEIRRSPAGHFSYEKTSHLPLTPQQQRVFEQIKDAIDSGAFAPMLLHGVTGSGKTEVYLQAIDYLLTAGRRAIVMVPEISLTPLLVSRFLSRFGEKIAVLHSGLSIGERYDEWLRIRRGEVEVVIGARSAIFAPLEGLGLIVVDEEHEMSYKQDSEPRYHGRDTAVMRARLENIPILLGSATPSLESYYNAETQKYQLLTIQDRVDKRPLPSVDVIDRCQEQGHHLFCNALEEAIRDTLRRSEQVLLFLNLRGFANFYMCRDCGFVYQCPRCNVTLTFHASSQRLQCHYCDFSRLPPLRCDNCGSPDVQYRGFGTERIEQEIQQLFPDVAVARMDRDTVSGKNSHYKILHRFEQRDIDILIGTQMIAKGHDFPNVTLVGVISAEIGLNLPDFRASERTFQILTQVAGRTGRGPLGGTVIIQTYSPSHYAIVAAQNHDYLTFYRQERTYREQLWYPPFSRIINLVFQGRDEYFTQNIAQQAATFLRQAADPKRLVVLGPSPAALTKLRNKYRYQVLLKSSYSLYMRTFVKEQLDEFCHRTRLKDLQILVDVDPMNLL